ncbi:hypothetical protein ABW20_dc0103431 [Dactylellina cionopaga]|nr:hypothetical protein ABW20_dc0103431 [Dactylellina cionopaga]
MKYSTFSRLLALAPLVASVSAWCDASSTNSYETCNTKYGDHPVYSTKYSSRSIHTGVTTTVTYTKPPVTVCTTITEPDETSTVETTSTCTERVWCPVTTIYVYKTETKTITVTNVNTKTAWTTKKVYGAPTTIPAPYGFVGVREDPDNSGNGNYKREANPPPAYQSYPTVIACTTYFTKTCTISKTVGPYTSTSTKTIPGHTYTVTHTDVTTTTVCANPTETTETKTKTETQTKYTESCTTVTKTKTINIPGPTKYAACDADKNIYSGVEPKDFNGGTKVSAGNAYDCCVACIKNSKCVGSYFVEGSYKSDQCWVKLSNQCYGQSQSLKFEKKSYGGGSISNGQCGKWKLKKSYY